MINLEILNENKFNELLNNTVVLDSFSDLTNLDEVKAKLAEYGAELTDEEAKYILNDINNAKGGKQPNKQTLKSLESLKLLNDEDLENVQGGVISLTAMYVIGGLCYLAKAGIAIGLVAAVGYGATKAFKFIKNIFG